MQGLVSVKPGKRPNEKCLAVKRREDGYLYAAEGQEMAGQGSAQGAGC